MRNIIRDKRIKPKVSIHQNKAPTMSAVCTKGLCYQCLSMSCKCKKCTCFKRNFLMGLQ